MAGRTLIDASSTQSVAAGSGTTVSVSSASVNIPQPGGKIRVWNAAGGVWDNGAPPLHSGMLADDVTIYLVLFTKSGLNSIFFCLASLGFPAGVQLQANGVNAALATPFDIILPATVVASGVPGPLDFFDHFQINTQADVRNTTAGAQVFAFNSVALVEVLAT